jgi:hypothetical protein
MIQSRRLAWGLAFFAASIVAAKSNVAVAAQTSAALSVTVATPLTVTLAPATATVVCNAAPGTVIAKIITTGGNGGAISFLSDATDFVAAGSNVAVGAGGIAGCPPPGGSKTEIVKISATQLPSAGYNFTSAGSSIDGGYGFYGVTPAVELHATLLDNDFQRWLWDGSRLANMKILANPGQAAGPYLADHGDGTATENASGDQFAVIPWGTGWLIQDKTTGRYLGILGGVLAFGATQTIWTEQ